MKFLWYGGLVLLLVPVQTTLLPHIAIWEIKPDLGLVVAAVVIETLRSLNLQFPQVDAAKRRELAAAKDAGRWQACWPGRNRF